MAARKALLTLIADAICGISDDRVQRVAVDGVDGSGKTTFADELAPLVAARGRPVIRASADSFHNPRAHRYRSGKDSPEGFFADSYNYLSLKSALLDPLAPGGSRRYKRAAFDHRSDSPVDAPEETAESGSIFLFDGLFLHRPELRSCWDFSLFLDVEFRNSMARMALRDGSSPDPKDVRNSRYVEGQKIYLSRCEPRSHASLVVDNNDLAAPIVTGGKKLALIKGCGPMSLAETE